MLFLPLLPVMNTLHTLSSALLLSGVLSGEAQAAPSQPEVSAAERSIQGLASCLRYKLDFPDKGEDFNATYVDFSRETTVRLDFKTDGVVGRFVIGSLDSASPMEFKSRDVGPDGHLDAVDDLSNFPSNVATVYQAWINELLASCNRLPSAAPHVFYNAAPLPSSLKASVIGIVDDKGDFSCSGHAVGDFVMNTANHCVDPFDPNSRVVWPAEYSSTGQPTAVYLTQYQVIPDAQAEKFDLAHLAIPAYQHHPRVTQVDQNMEGQFFGFTLGRPFSTAPFRSYRIAKGSSGGLAVIDRRASVFSAVSYLSNLTANVVASLSPTYRGHVAPMQTTSPLQFCPLVPGKAFGWTEGQILLDERVDISACKPVVQ